MTRSFDELRREIDADPVRRERVNQIKAGMIDALRLAEVREARQETQRSIASNLSVSQGRISQIEHGHDLRLSTLESYVGALGGRLKLQVEFSDGEQYELLSSVETDAAP